MFYCTQHVSVPNQWDQPSHFKTKYQHVLWIVLYTAVICPTDSRSNAGPTHLLKVYVYVWSCVKCHSWLIFFSLVSAAIRVCLCSYTTKQRKGQPGRSNFLASSITQHASNLFYHTALSAHIPLQHDYEQKDSTNISTSSITSVKNSDCEKEKILVECPNPTQNVVCAKFNLKDVGDDMCGIELHFHFSSQKVVLIARHQQKTTNHCKSSMSHI